MNWRKIKKLWRRGAWGIPTPKGSPVRRNGSNHSMRTMNQICGYSKFNRFLANARWSIEQDKKAEQNKEPSQ